MRGVQRRVLGGGARRGPREPRPVRGHQMHQQEGHPRQRGRARERDLRTPEVRLLFWLSPLASTLDLTRLDSTRLLLLMLHLHCTALRGFRADARRVERSGPEKGELRE